MQYYRRKPLDSSSSKGRRTSPDNSVASVARRQTLTPLSTPLESLSPPTEQAPTPAAYKDVEARERSAPQGNPMQDAAALVQKAASILDEEMAAGVIAARDARRPASGSAAGSMGEPSGANKQLRRDVHDFIDAFADWVTRMQGPLGEWLAAMGGTEGDAEQTGLEAKHESVPVLRPREPVRAGGRAKIALKVHNDNTQPARLTLCCTDLLSSSEYRIPEHQVVFTPRELKLEPDASMEVNLHIGVPQGTPAGTYSALLVASGLPYLRAVIALEVE